MKTEKDQCKHEYGTYKHGRSSLHCAECGIKLDMITRRPIDVQLKEVQS